ncbi:MAG: FAD-dependent oxidoreductase, partial [Nitrososphaerota archaeon]
MTKDVYDLLVIGAGIFGLSSAYHYAKRANNKIIVIDSQSGPGQGNTAKSVGGFRKGLFTSNLNRVLSESTTSFLIDLHNSGYDLGLSQVGYLILLDKDHYEKFIEMVRPIQYKGYATLLSPEELARKIPFINLKFSDDEEAEILGLKDIATALYSPLSGYIDVEKLVNYYYEQLVDMGVEFLFNTKVEKLALKPLNSIGHPREPLAWQKKKFVGAETNKGLI